MIVGIIGAENGDLRVKKLQRLGGFHRKIEVPFFFPLLAASLPGQCTPRARGTDTEGRNESTGGRSLGPTQVINLPSAGRCKCILTFIGAERVES
jgi:hypothetical protein